MADHRHFSITIDIAASPERVYEVMSDVERWPEWTRSVSKITRVGGGEFVVGSRMVIRQPKFPPAMWRLLAITPGRAFTWESPAPGLRTVAHHTIEPLPTGSRVMLSLELHGLLGGIFGRLIRGVTLRYLDMEANGLKARSENPAFHVS